MNKAVSLFAMPFFMYTNYSYVKPKLGVP